MKFLTNPWTIGVTVSIIGGIIAILIAYFVFGIGKSKNGTEQTVSSITPAEIYESIDKLPPFQIKQASSNYRGRKIKWDIEFYNTYSIFGINYVHGSTGGVNSHSIFFRISLRRYPEIKTMKRGDRFLVIGTISSVRAGGVDLRKCQLFFSETKLKSNQQISTQMTSSQNNVTSVLSPSQPTPTQQLIKPSICITPEEIQQSLQQLPPFQIEQASKNFEGLEIEWLVKLQSTKIVSNGFLIATTTPDNSTTLIFFTVDIERYPELKTMKQDEQFTIKGKIASVRKYQIDLKDCNLHFNK